MNNGIHINLQGLQQANTEINGMPARIDGLLRRHTVLKQIGTQMAASAVTTINQGGRPIAYKPLAESTKKAKLQKYKKESRILIAEGTLRESLDYEVEGGQLYLTSVEHLKYHQFEDDRQNPDTFPARPVWGIHPEDHDEIIDIIITELKK